MQPEFIQRATRLHEGHIREMKLQGKGKKIQAPLPIGFYKTGLNQYKQINGNGETITADQLLASIDCFRSVDIFYPSGELTSEEKIDRLKLNEAIEGKFRGKGNIQIVADFSGVAITVKPAKVVIVFPVEFKLSESELIGLASKVVGVGNVGSVDTLAQINFQDQGKLEAQLTRYKSKGYIVLNNPDI